jgi:hypothetical protein
MGGDTLPDIMMMVASKHALWGSPDLVDKGGGMREKEHKYGNE